VAAGIILLEQHVTFKSPSLFSGTASPILPYPGPEWRHDDMIDMK
jgi:hypothetical protein